MKKIDTKIKKPNIDISKKLPYIFIALFLIVGVAIVIYGYLLLNREPADSVVKNAQSEMDELKTTFSKKKTDKIFDSTYDTLKIQSPGYLTKNPFSSF